jgi:hypothetical protein
MPVPPLPLLLPEDPLVDPDELPELEPLVELPLLVDDPPLVDPLLVDDVLLVEPPLLVEPLLVDPPDEPPDEEPPEDGPHEGDESLLPQAAARGTPQANTHATNFFVRALIRLLLGELPSAVSATNTSRPECRTGARCARIMLAYDRPRRHSDHRCRLIGVQLARGQKVCACAREFMDRDLGNPFMSERCTAQAFARPTPTQPVTQGASR